MKTLISVSKFFLETLLTFYKRHRRIIWSSVFILPAILPMLIFLWEIDARNLKSSCFPQQTFLSCFSGENTQFLLVGFIGYPVKYYLWFFIRLLIPLAFIEFLFLIAKYIDYLPYTPERR